MPPTAPLTNRRIVVTRPAAQAEPFCAMLRDAGAVAILVPAIGIESISDMSAMTVGDVVLMRWISYAPPHASERWIVFTSVNAVEQFWLRLTTYSMSAADLQQFLTAISIGAVGPETARALTDRGVTPTLVASSAHSAALADALRESALRDLRDANTTAPPHVLWPCAERATESFADQLRRDGCVVDAVPLYRTASVLSRDAVDDAFAEPIDAVTFASGSAVRAWHDVLGDRGTALLASTCVACIGPSTAAVARECGIPVTIVATEHTSRGLVDALATHFASPTASSSRPSLPFDSSESL